MNDGLDSAKQRQVMDPLDATIMAPHHHAVLLEKVRVLDTVATKPEIGGAFWSAPLAPHYVRNVGVADPHVIAVEVKFA